MERMSGESLRYLIINCLEMHAEDVCCPRVSAKETMLVIRNVM